MDNQVLRPPSSRLALGIVVYLFYAAAVTAVCVIVYALNQGLLPYQFVTAPADDILRSTRILLVWIALLGLIFYSFSSRWRVYRIFSDRLEVCRPGRKAEVWTVDTLARVVYYPSIPPVGFCTLHAKNGRQLSVDEPWAVQPVVQLLTSWDHRP